MSDRSLRTVVPDRRRVYSPLRGSVGGVFISYRRDDSPGHAGRIFDCLRARLGSDSVFMDVHALRAGEDFVEALDDAAGSCDALLAIIGPGWMSAADSDGRRRLDDPLDFVRLEIGAGLKRGVAVIPVLVDHAALPTQADLPDELKPLTRRNALELRDSRWDVDIDELVQSVEKLITSRDSRPDTTREPSPTGRSRRTRYRAWGAVAGSALVAAGTMFGPRGCASAPDETMRGANADPRVPLRAEPSAGAAAGTRDTVGGAPTAADATPDPSSRTAAGQLPLPAPPSGLGVGWFGLWLDTVTDTPPGVIVDRVAPGGPAANAGLQGGDVITEVAGQPVTSFAEVAAAVVDHVRSTPPGTEAIVAVVRRDQHIRLPVIFDRGFVLPR